MSSDFLSAYEENVWSVYGYLAYRTATREEAEDLTQVTFERALRAWSRFDPSRASPRTWLLVIARNALIDERRRDRAAVPIDDDTSAVWADPALSVPGPDESRGGVGPELEAALGRLQPQERDVLALRYGGDLTTGEISELLDLTVANVQQIASRGRRKLRRELEARADSGGVPSGP